MKIDLGIVVFLIAPDEQVFDGVAGLVFDRLELVVAGYHSLIKFDLGDLPAAGVADDGAFIHGVIGPDGLLAMQHAA